MDKKTVNGKFTVFFVVITFQFIYICRLKH